MSTKTYVFNTERGDGIPGIPHEISEAEAKELGVEKLLADAIASGAYLEKSVRGERSDAKPKRTTQEETKE